MDKERNEKPEKSPWGKVDYVQPLAAGAYVVSTPSHGGLMLDQVQAARLSPPARAKGEGWGTWLCFEEDCRIAVPLIELEDLRTATGIDRADLLRTATDYDADYLEAVGVDSIAKATV